MHKWNRWIKEGGRDHHAVEAIEGTNSWTREEREHGKWSVKVSDKLANVFPRNAKVVSMTCVGQRM